MLRVLLLIPLILLTSVLSASPFTQTAETLPYIEIPRADNAYPVGVAWQPVDGSITVATREAVHVYQPDGTLIATREGDEIIRAIAWNPDGTTLAVGLDKGQLQFWQYEAGKFIRDEVIDAGSEAVFSIDYSPDNRMIAVMNNHSYECGSDSCIVRWHLAVYDAQTKELLHKAEPSIGMSSFEADVLSWSADSQYLTVVGNTSRGEIVQYETNTWEIIATRSPFSEVMTMVADPEGEFVVFNTGDLYIFDDQFSHSLTALPLDAETSERGEASPDMPAPYERVEYQMRSWITAVDWHPARDLIAVGDRSGDVQILRFTSDALVSIATLRAHPDNMVDLTWSPAGDQLATISSDGTILLWKDFEHSYTPEENAPTLTFHVQSGLRKAVWLPQSRWIVTADDHTLAVYNSSNGQREVLIHPDGISDETRIRSFQFSDNGKRLLVTTALSDDNSRTAFLIYDVELKDEPFAMDLKLIADTEINEQLTGAVLSPSGNQVVYYFGYYGGGHDSRDLQPQAVIWDITTGEEQIMESGYLRKIRWGSDEKFVLYSKQNNTSAHLHDIENNTRAVSFSGIAPLCCGSGYNFRDFDWQADVAAFTSWGRVDLWHLPQSEAVEKLSEIWADVGQVALHPDGKILAGLQNFITFNGRERGVKSANLNLWDVETGDPVRLIVIEDSDIGNIQWSSDGKMIMAWDADSGAIHLWEIDPRED